jgi:hypothetical protein
MTPTKTGKVRRVDMSNRLIGAMGSLHYQKGSGKPYRKAVGKFWRRFFIGPVNPWGKITFAGCSKESL